MDYEETEKIIPAKINSLEWIMQNLEYENEKAERSITDFNNAEVVSLDVRQLGGLMWVDLLIVGGLVFSIAQYDTDPALHDHPLYYSERVDEAGAAGRKTVMGNTDMYCNIFWSAYVSSDDPNLLNFTDKFALVSAFISQQYRATLTFVEADVNSNKSQVLTYLRAYYDQLDPRLRPLPYYNPVVEEEVLPTDDEAFPGDFPKAPGFHLDYFDALAFYVPDNYVMDEVAMRRSNSEVIIMKPSLFALDSVIRLIFPKRLLSAYNKADEYVYQEPMSSQYRMSFNTSFWRETKNANLMKTYYQYITGKVQNNYRMYPVVELFNTVDHIKSSSLYSIIQKTGQLQELLLHNPVTKVIQSISRGKNVGGEN